MNHFSRLLRLARRTGDRLIVTDEQGSEEPLVILPLDEYEVLIEGAFGPAGSLGCEERGLGLKMGEGFSGLDGMRDSDILEDIQIDDVPEMVPGVELPELEHLDSDEAEIDEEALKPLWEPAKSVEIKDKTKENQKKVHPEASVGEEGFYLESID